MPDDPHPPREWVETIDGRTAVVRRLGPDVPSESPWEPVAVADVLRRPERYANTTVRRFSWNGEPIKEP